MSMTSSCLEALPAAQDAALQLRHALALEGQATAEHGVERDARAPHLLALMS